MSATAHRSRRYRARVAPRDGSRGAGSRIEWDKVGRVVLVLVLVFVLFSYVRPLINVFDTWRESGAAAQQLNELRAENQQLERRAKELNTPEAAIREARALGLVGEGEQAYKVEGLE